jgi:hypothetical protein
MSLLAEVTTELTIVLGLLVDGEYEVLESMTKAKNLTAVEMREAVESYGRTLARPPEGQLPASVDVIELEGAPPRRLFVVLPLMTQEEGLSDLSVEMTLTEVAPHLWLIAMESIHVL